MIWTPDKTLVLPDRPADRRLARWLKLSWPPNWGRSTTWVRDCECEENCHDCTCPCGEENTYFNVVFTSDVSCGFVCVMSSAEFVLIHSLGCNWTVHCITNTICSDAGGIPEAFLHQVGCELVFQIWLSYYWVVYTADIRDWVCDYPLTLTLADQSDVGCDWPASITVEPGGQYDCTEPPVECCDGITMPDSISVYFGPITPPPGPLDPVGCDQLENCTFVLPKISSDPLTYFSDSLIACDGSTIDLKVICRGSWWISSDAIPVIACGKASIICDPLTVTFTFISTGNWNDLAGCNTWSDWVPCRYRGDAVVTAA